MSNVVVFPLTRRAAREHPSLQWEVLDRVRDFCERTASEDSPHALRSQIMTALGMEEPTTLVWVAIDETGGLVGHLVAAVVQDPSRRWVEISQYELASGLPSAVLKDGLTQIESWGARWDACQIRVFTEGEIRDGHFISPLARAYRTFYGFREHRVLMVKEIDHDLAN